MNEIKERIAEFNDEALLADGFDEAIIGVVNQGGSSRFVVLYDSDKCIEIIAESMMNGGLEPGEDCDLYLLAQEYFEYNVAGSYVGDNTPMFLTRLDEY